MPAKLVKAEGLTEGALGLRLAWGRVLRQWGRES